MTLDETLCYRAIASRDARFDGRFFTAVTTTGIYCRPVCPARTPRRQHVRFYPCAAAAEAAGFRPCRRCRPETAPGSPAWTGTSATVSRALRLIADGGLDEAPLEVFAGRLGLGSRHVRRLFETHLGASPSEIARARRTHFAKTLLDDTALPITDIAFAAGFGSLRQFNDVMKERYGAPPRVLRRATPSHSRSDGGVVIRLPFRPPFDWGRLLAFLSARATRGVELIEGEAYRRTCAFDNAVGTIAVTPDPTGAPALMLRVDLPSHKPLIAIAERARRLFDLGADPAHIMSHLSRSAVLRPLLRRAPGLRVPGAWDPFETIVRAVVGQQVSVAAATTIVGRIVERCGRPVDGCGHGLTHLFPLPDAIAEADLESIGMPSARVETLRRIAQAVADHRLPLDGALDLEEVVDHLCAIRGIGRWTAHYIAMRALGEPDAFPSGDLGLRKAVGLGTPVDARELDALAESWRPWRAYAAMYLWGRGGRGDAGSRSRKGTLRLARTRSARSGQEVERPKSRDGERQ